MFRKKFVKTNRTLLVLGAVFDRPFELVNFGHSGIDFHSFFGVSVQTHPPFDSAGLES
jgi:hypothetical protein